MKVSKQRQKDILRMKKRARQIYANGKRTVRETQTLLAKEGIMRSVGWVGTAIKG